MKHCIMAAKGDTTPHDVAELTLVTLDHYRRQGPTVGAPEGINHEGDARNIAHFLKEHLPAETLKELLKQLAEEIPAEVNTETWSVSLTMEDKTEFLWSGAADDKGHAKPDETAPSSFW